MQEYCCKRKEIREYLINNPDMYEKACGYKDYRKYFIDRYYGINGLFYDTTEIARSSSKQRSICSLNKIISRYNQNIKRTERWVYLHRLEKIGYMTHNNAAFYLGINPHKLSSLRELGFIKSHTFRQIKHLMYCKDDLKKIKERIDRKGIDRLIKI